MPALQLAGLLLLLLVVPPAERQKKIAWWTVVLGHMSEVLDTQQQV
jgi:hypothetical protein